MLTTNAVIIPTGAPSHQPIAPPTLAPSSVRTLDMLGAEDRRHLLVVVSSIGHGNKYRWSSNPRQMRGGNEPVKRRLTACAASFKRLLGGADLDDPQEYSRAVVATNRVKQLTRDSEPRAVGRSELRPH